jgi:peptide/nickel transport system substrate-binding protein
MRKARMYMVLLVLLMLTVSMGRAQEEKVLVIGHAESTDSLDPARGYTQTTGVVNKATYETLVTFPDEDASSIEPQLATDWSVSDDGLEYTFTLQDGVTFSNGDPLTAADVVYSINRLKYINGNPAPLASNVASVEAPDDQTVVITLASVDPSYLTKLANSAYGVVNSTEVAAEGGSDAEDASTSDTAEAYLNAHSAGTGPYMLDHWDSQVETVLVRNPNYWGDAPYFDRVIITNIPEAATQKVALESGEIDVALDLTSDQITGLEGNEDIAIFSGPGNITHFLLMNKDPEIGGPMADPNVQLAVRYALDYQGYADLWGGITPGSNLAVGIQGAFGPDQAFTRDLDMAKQLMTDAGYADGFDVTMDYPLFTFQGVNMDTNAQKIQADLAEIGINVTLNPAEVQVALEGYRAGTQGFAYWFWGPDVLDPLDILSFLPCKIKAGTEDECETGNVGGRANWTDENADQEILDLRDQARVETDADARLDLFSQIQDYEQQHGPFAPFLQPNVQTAFRSDIEGYVWHPQWLIDVALLSRAE